LKIPRSLVVEHDELHIQLQRAVGENGKLGRVAAEVARLLNPHLVKEEEFALPPLGLLNSVLDGKEMPEVREVLKITERSKKELPQMIREHRAIVEVLKKLVVIARKEGKFEYARFADKLILHFQNEEEVLYPAAILVGEYLKMKLQR